jgi:hypothetical protein
MTDPETKVRDLLSELAAQAAAPAELERPTLRRARRRRVSGAVVSLVVILGLALGGFELFRAVQAPAGPAGEGTPNPTPAQVQGFAGLWPETDADALAAAQKAARDGHQPWRLDPVQTAQALAVDFFGWPQDEASTSTEEQHVNGSTAQVNLVDPMFGDPVPPIALELQQLGVTGPEGVWSVTAVTSPLIELGPIAASTDGTMISVSGSLADSLFDPTRIGPSWAPKEIQVSFVAGPTFDPSAGGVLPLDRTFSGTWPAPTGDQTVVVWVRVLDVQGRALGATAVRLDTGPGNGGDATPTPQPQALPAAVAATRSAIYDASVRGDFEALRSLIDPDHFSYNFSDGHDPIPEWKQQPAILDTFVKLLDMPFSVRHTDTGDVYSWPYFTDADPTTLTEADHDLLATLGITRKDVEGMIAFGAYTGPRLGIAEDGRWLSYTVGGD